MVVSMATSCLTPPPQMVENTALVGEWRSDVNTLSFEPDGAMSQTEGGTTYDLRYSFDGEILCVIQIDGAITYEDHLFVYRPAAAEINTEIDPDTFAVAYYEYIYERAVGEIWDPELMSFDEEASRDHFANYIAEFERSGEAIDEWFDRYTRVR